MLAVFFVDAFIPAVTKTIVKIAPYKKILTKVPLLLFFGSLNLRTRSSTIPEMVTAPSKYEVVSDKLNVFWQMNPKMYVKKSSRDLWQSVSLADAPITPIITATYKRCFRNAINFDFLKKSERRWIEEIRTGCLRY